MRTRLLVAPITILLAASTAWAGEQQQPSTAEMEGMIAKLHASHIAANVPPDAAFMKLLRRDVAAYLSANHLPSKSVSIEPLRKGATQSGVSFPKYYIWVRAGDDKGRRVEGAMRVAAIDRLRFEVTDFTQVDAIRSDPASLASIYPAVLIPSIRQHAGSE